MAMFTVIEINGDHVQDLVDNEADLARVLRNIVSNRLGHEHQLAECGFDRAIRVVGQFGERMDPKGRGQ